MAVTDLGEPAMAGFWARGLSAAARPPAALPNHHHHHIHNNAPTDNGPVLNAIREVGDEFKTLKTHITNEMNKLTTVMKVMMQQRATSPYNEIEDVNIGGPLVDHGVKPTDTVLRDDTGTDPSAPLQGRGDGDVLSAATATMVG